MSDLPRYDDVEKEVLIARFLDHDMTLGQQEALLTLIEERPELIREIRDLLVLETYFEELTGRTEPEKKYGLDDPAICYRNSVKSARVGPWNPEWKPSLSRRRLFSVLSTTVYFFPICFMITLLVVVGCGRQVKMGGRVTFSDNGDPLTMGTVVFKTEIFQARGEINPDGSYQIGSFKYKDGLPRGTYQVYVTGAIQQEEGTDGSTVEIPLIDMKYANPNKSGLTVTVDGSTKTFDFQIDRPPVSSSARKKPKST